MKATQLQQIESINFLKVVNNSLNNATALTKKVNRIYINTMMPGFNYINKLGEVVTPQKCVLL
ncbi:MAG: hypothetical protein Q7U59_07245 [Lutibacter sp.]|jgi:DeoR/GlpR family transcriptional regulator of sugar metabolism|nr:hypothetical protein [Lutibacter sp.]MDP3357865.1 hypothetical protein [Lutibacter sp.]